MPKVSIIIPNYNYRAYLPQRLQSVFAQTYTDYEVILLDDCSTDGSREYLEQVARERGIKACVCNKENTGNPFVQWRRGIDMACGDYVWIAESDDYCDSTFLARLVPLLDGNPDAAYVQCGSHIVDGQGAPLKRNFDTWGRDDRHAYKYAPWLYLAHYLLWRNTSYNASMILFRRSVAQQMDRRHDDMRYSGDWMFWMKMAERGSVIVLHERLNYFRRHDTSVTKKADGGMAQLMERLRIHSYILRRHNFGRYRMSLALGDVYWQVKKAKRRAATPDERKLAELLLEKYDVYRRHYVFYRCIKLLHALLPWVPSPRHDDIAGEDLGLAP